MKKSNFTPPKLAEWITKKLSNQYNRQSSLGDLSEMYSYMAEDSGVRSAKKWYWKQVISSIPFLFKSSLSKNHDLTKNNIKIGWRSIRKNKRNSIINISGLTVGLVSVITTMLWVQFEYSFDRFHSNRENLYKVAFYAEKFDARGDYLPTPTGTFLQENFPEIEYAVNLKYRTLKMANAERVFGSSGYFVQPSFFDMFTFPLIYSDDPDSLFKDRFSIVITETLANKLFQSSDVVGKNILIENQVNVKITGVMKDIPVNSTIQFEYLLPFRLAPGRKDIWNVKSDRVYAMLVTDDHEAVSKKIKNIYNDRNPNDAKNDFYLEPFNRIHLYNLNGDGIIYYIYIFSAMALVILLTACINFMNLSTAISEKRIREIGVRMVVGSTRKQLAVQFLTQSMILTLVSFGLSKFISDILILFLGGYLGVIIKVFYPLEIYASMFVVVVLTGLISGWYPARYISSFDPVRILKGAASKGSQKLAFFKKGLVVFQFTIAIFFIISSMVITKQTNYMRSKDLGFNKENILVIPMQNDLSNQVGVLKDKLLAIPSIRSVTVSSQNFVRWGKSTGLDWAGKDENLFFDVGFNQVDYDFLDTFELELTEGRFFSRNFPSDVNDSFVINEALARKIGFKNIIGTELVSAKGTGMEKIGTVIGIVKDYHTESLHGEIRPFILEFGDRSYMLCIKLEEGTKGNVLDEVSSAMTSLRPGHPFNYSFLDDNLDSGYQFEILTGNFILFLAYLSIFISCLGLYGLAAYSVESRTKEVGIRKAFGATRAEIVRLFTVNFVGLVLISNAIAWVISDYASEKWLESFYYRIELGYVIPTAAGVLALFIALVTVGLQAHKAGSANPVDSLRYE